MTNANLLDPPRRQQAARFAEGFGPRALLTVDTEEEFDWKGDFSRDGYGLDSIRRIAKLQQFCEGIGVSPVYLVDWPVANSPVAQEVIGSAVAAGKAEIGIQLHPWVNPPFDEEVDRHNSFAGNLPHALEREKFTLLRDLIEEKFATPPRIYRAGRYGIGRETARMLADTGVAIDTSVRACFDYSAEGGPDYSAHPVAPYWADGERKLLELPLTTVYWGMLRRQGETLYPLTKRFPRAAGVLSRLGLLERIALTPEGVSSEEALRGIDIALDDGLPLLVLSFHSPSLVPGYTPYVRDEDDLDRFYEWLRSVYGYFDLRGVRPTTVAEIMDAVDV
ncbi:polysaccharide deacetylase family protein [Qipengyuania sp. RANM35]|uniref:polysaccharide deacetylase family protein n=1 Tax=Qipengyuania sp. RANM35 TaxID=3068635 RepID=UPI0034DACF37